jgi:hypothetical protein
LAIADQRGAAGRYQESVLGAPLLCKRIKPAPIARYKGRHALCEPSPFPVRNYTATIRVAPIVETNSAFVEWRATFDELH